MEVVTKIWTGQKLKKEICCDTETTMAPFHTFDHKLVLFQATDIDGIVYLVRNEDVRRFFNRHHYATFIWHNAVFDLDVLIPFLGQERIFELIDEGRIMCTKLLYILYKLAITGVAEQRVSLKGLVKEFYNVDLEKGQERITFGQYLGKPIEDISENHIKYAALDVIYTFRVYCDLMARIKPLDKMNTLLSYQIQIKGDYALNRIYKNGIGFDLPRKDAWMKDTTKRLFDLQEVLSTYGWVRGAPGVNDRLAGIFEHIGIADKLSRTESGKLSSSTKELAYFKQYPFVKDYINFIELEKLSQFVRNLHDPILHPKYSVLKVTGRTGCSGPNIQNVPKEGNIRGMYIPKSKGNVFVDTDYNSLELAALAQVCLETVGSSKLADTINKGLCPHVKTASEIFKKDAGSTTKEDMGQVTKSDRQLAKIANFGFGANMGIDTFVGHAKKQGVELSTQMATTVKSGFLSAFPEMNKYFKLPNKYDNGDRTFTHTTLTGRIKANCHYSSFLNLGFQGLSADGAKLALYEIMKEGLDMSAFIHDAVVVETEASKAEDTKAKLEELMIKGMKQVIPDVAIGVESQITERFSK